VRRCEVCEAVVTRKGGKGKPNPKKRRRQGKKKERKEFFIVDDELRVVGRGGCAKDGGARKKC